MEDAAPADAAVEDALAYLAEMQDDIDEHSECVPACVRARARACGHLLSPARPHLV